MSSLRQKTGMYDVASSSSAGFVAAVSVGALTSFGGFSRETMSSSVMPWASAS